MENAILKHFCRYFWICLILQKTLTKTLYIKNWNVREIIVLITKYVFHCFFYCFSQLID